MRIGDKNPVKFETLWKGLFGIMNTYNYIQLIILFTSRKILTFAWSIFKFKLKTNHTDSNSRRETMFTLTIDLCAV